MSLRKIILASWILSAVNAACDGNASGGFPVETETLWTLDVESGYEGSPSLCDLNHDGHAELIFPFTDNFTMYPRVIAADAETGDVVWINEDSIHAYSYPFCIDVNGDSTDDVLVAGRTGDLIALSGVDGAILWSLADLNPSTFPSDTEFVHSVVGVGTAPDILFVTFSGRRGISAAGGVIAFNRADGVIRAVWEEPDGREIYSSAAVYAVNSTRTLVAVGSGGETLSGEMYVLEFNSMTDEFGVEGSVPSFCEDGGVVASPMFGDLDGDETPEVVGTDYCGTIFATDLDADIIWSVNDGVQFGTANPVMADFDGDGLLDVLAVFESLNFSRGIPDRYESSIQAFKGTNGDKLWSSTIPKIVFGTPVTVDVDLDGIEDPLIPEANLLTDNLIGYREGITIISGATGQLIDRIGYGCWLGSPVIGNIDADDSSTELFVYESGLVDAFDEDHEFENRGGRIVGIRLPSIGFDPEAVWSGFRGQPVHDGYRD